MQLHIQTRLRSSPCQKAASITQVPYNVGRKRLVIQSFKGSPEQFKRAPATEAASSEQGLEAAFKKSVDVMLNRAASSLTRGTCTCLSCRGQGVVECAHCKGTGRLNPQAVERAGLLRGTLLKLRTAMGMSPHDVPYASSEWMRTNRCPRCHGQGRLACEPCSGSGRRFPYQSGEKQQQQ